MPPPTEEPSGTAEALADQTEQLQGLVGRFKLDAGHPPGSESDGWRGTPCGGAAARPNIGTPYSRGPRLSSTERDRYNRPRAARGTHRDGAGRTA